MTLTASLATPELTVDPGGFVRTQATVRNIGVAPSRARVSVTGPAARWSFVVPPDVDLEPGAEAVVTVGFRTTRSAGPAAGRLEFQVVAEPATGSAPAAGASGVLIVTPFRDISVELDGRGAGPVATEYHVVVDNRGNVPAGTLLEAAAGQAVDLSIGTHRVHAQPGERVRVPVTVRPGSRPLLRNRTVPFTVSATPDDGPPVTLSGEVQQIALVTRTAARIIVAVAVLLLAVVVRVTVLAPDGSPSTAVAAGGTGISSTAVRTTATPTSRVRCPADEHRNAAVTGLNPQDIPILPPDFSFFEVAADGCSPVRWNPCEPIHFVINPAGAPPTGVADTKEAFKRLGEATGLVFVDDGTTDERGQGDRAFQPGRYGDRWAPILVHWTDAVRSQGETQIVGGGFPTRVGDVYVTANLTLSPMVVTNQQTRTTIAGGFGDELTIGRIGPEGITWGRVILHELGHIVGLGHVSQPSQLMYPEASDHTSATAFQDGDLAGLRYLGKEAGCLEPPPPGTTTRGRRQ